MSMMRNLIIANANQGIVTNGRILHLDGIDNTDAGHGNTATTWKSLVGGANTTLNKDSWGEDHLVTDGTVTGNTNFQVMPSMDDFTVEAVVSHSILSDQFYMTQRTAGSGSALGLYEGNQVIFYMPGGYSTRSGFYPAVNQKYYVTVTRSSNRLAIYINGGYTGQSTNTGEVPTINMSLLDYGSGLIPFKGKMFLSGAYDRSLSDSEILQNYNYYKARFGI